MAAPATTTGTTAHGGAAPAHGGSFPPFQGDTFASQLLWLAITFGFLYWLSAKVIVPRLGGILEDRANKIGNDLDEAAAMKAKAEEAGQAYEKSLAEARAKSQAIAQETREKVNADSAARRKTVEADLAAKLADAEATIVATKTEAMSHVGAIAADAASAIVNRLTGAAPAPADAAKAVKTALGG